MAKRVVSEVEGKGVSQESVKKRLPGVLEDKGPLLRVHKDLKIAATRSGGVYWYRYLSDHARIEFKDITAASKYFLEST